MTLFLIRTATPPRRAWWLGVWALTSLAWSAYGWAESLQDPTKPPAVVLPYLPGQLAAAEQPWELSALHAADKQSFAIINGQTVHMGQVFEGYTLRAVSQRQAVLVNAQGEQKRLAMANTGITMTPVLPEGPGALAAKATPAKIKKSSNKKLSHGQAVKPPQAQPVN